MPRTRPWKNVPAVGAGKKKSSPMLLKTTVDNLECRRTLSGDNEGNRNAVPVPSVSRMNSVMNQKVPSTSTSKDVLKSNKMKTNSRLQLPAESEANESIQWPLNAPVTNQKEKGDESNYVNWMSGSAAVKNNTAKKRPLNFLEFCEIENVSYYAVRKNNRQPARYGDPSGLVYDTFELPEEFAGQEIPPMPPTPVAANNAQISSDEAERQKNSFKKANDEWRRKELRNMNINLAAMNSDRAQRQRERETKGIPMPDYAAEGDARDLNSSFSMEYTPSPVAASVGVNNKRVNVTNTPHANVNVDIDTTPSKRAKTGWTMECCQVPPKHRTGTSTLRSLNSAKGETRSQYKRTRLFEASIQSSLEDEEEEWPDDDVLTQIDLEALELACSHNRNVDVAGVGFEEDDADEERIFSQIAY